MFEIIGEAVLRIVIWVVSFFVELAYNVARAVFSLTKGPMWARVLSSALVFCGVLAGAYCWLVY